MSYLMPTVAEENENRKIREDMRSDMSIIKLSIAEILAAIEGNSLTKDGGLAGRMTIVERDLLKLAVKVGENESKEKEQKLYVTIMWAGLCAVVMVVLIELVGYFIHK